jgi:hypothetical protein
MKIKQIKNTTSIIKKLKNRPNNHGGQNKQNYNKPATSQGSGGFSKPQFSNPNKPYAEGKNYNNNNQQSGNRKENDLKKPEYIPNQNKQTKVVVTDSGKTEKNTLQKPEFNTNTNKTNPSLDTKTTTTQAKPQT